jgi:diguanylate cyclase (GGDEF)-like protein
MVGVVVLLSGARLIALSMHERAVEMRASAQAAVVRHAQLIDVELQGLTDRASREARLAANIPADRARVVTAPMPVPPARGTFLMSATGVVAGAGPSEALLSRALASDLASGGAAVAAAPGLFGPVRYGSEWFIVAEAPIAPQAAQPGRALRAAAPSGGELAVAYEGLDALLMRARFGRLVNEGYDFELSQGDARGHNSRVLFSSRPEGLNEPVVSGIGAARYLQLAIRPQGGWYPARVLTAEISLLALLTWALAFGAHDLTGSLRRARAALTATRDRLHAANRRLIAEIEEHQVLRQSLEHARYHDPFTGLPNRRCFMDRLDRALRELRTLRRRHFAVFLLDVDRFTLINDSLGQAAGDELMLLAARRFAGALGKLEFIVARWGGGQLAVLVYDVASGAAAQAVAATLQEAARELFVLRQHRVRIAVRIGYTCIDSGLQRAEDALREADVAVAFAKRQPSALTVEYTPGLGGAAASLVSLEADLHIALERRELRLLFQPIVDLRGHRAVGAEALLRWHHPVEGLLTPDRFLAIAEEVGVIVPVTRWIIQRVCRLAGEWRQRLPAGADFYISVNLSPAVVRYPGLRDYVAQVLKETQTPPRHLKFELTEGGVAENVGTARDVLEAFRGMGIELMLDDFGTGHSSLSYLQLLPFDYVKIDRPFVNRTGSERANNAITAAVLQMTSSLGLRSVAEVVETQATAQALAQLGCEFAQGNFFSAPVEAEEAFAQLREYGSASAAAAKLRAASGAAAEADPATSSTLVLTAAVELPGGVNDDTVVLKQSEGGG